MIKKISRFISDFIWIFPFIGFLSGYFVALFYVQNLEVIVPNIIGKNVYKGLSLLSAQHLGMRIQQEFDSELFSPGTILDQSPKANDTIRMNQHVYVTIAKKPDPIKAPEVQFINQNEILQRFNKLGINFKFYKINSNQLEEKCIAQYPNAGELIIDNKMSILISQKKDTYFLIPNIKGMSLDSVKEIFDKTNIVLEVFHQETDSIHNKNNGIIIDQYPVAGTVVDGNTQLVIQVEV